ncbi:MAG: cytochrome c biogenesis protein CcsA [Candidatus Hydrogenedentes bacterium]|nr:cytochrome c biogenesis protein CcsA [Candidatus Hydrogenedentota bacterium]
MIARTPLLLTLALALGLATLAGAQAQETPATPTPAAEAAAPEAAAPEAAKPAPEAREPWSKEIVETFATLPVQDGGRVKPLDTYAQFAMLQMNGKRTFKTESGEKLTPIPWLLDALFYPEIAKTYQHFVVDNYDVVSAIGVDIHDNRRSRYSYNELEPGFEKLMRLADDYNAIDAKKRDLVQQGVLDLANKFFTFTQLIHFMDFAGQRFTVTGDTSLAKSFPEADGVTMSVALERAAKVLASLKGNPAGLSNDAVQAEVAAFSKLLDEFDATAGRAQGLPLFPPANAETKAWQTPADILSAAIGMTQNEPETFALLGTLEKLPSLVKDRPAFLAAAQEFHKGTVARAESRGEYAKVPLEVHYYKGKYLFYSQWLYVLSFILVAFGWLFPRSGALHKAAIAGVLFPTALLIIGITLRCIIRERPPISTLYETVLFITACAVLVAMFIEYANRQRIALAMASFLGMAGMFLAFRYEMKEGVDTMPSLVAVLDTNFWLATHVTIINVGYAAGMLSGALAHIYIFSRLFKFKADNKEYYRSLTRMVYGVLCFGLLFSTVGTILGGIWANDSWGRFWGWDPKENGALMICLWSLVILHAKMGRHIKDMGISQGAVVLAMIVAFSWWGVNQLGVGLHSYGFTSGIMNALVVYWAFETLTIAAGAWVWMREREPAPPEAPKETKLPKKAKPAKA